MRPEKLKAAISKLSTALDTSPRRVFGLNALTALLEEHRKDSKLPTSVPTSQLIDFLTPEGLRIVRLRPSSGNMLTRYAWRDASDFGIALSVFNKLYLCHLSAMVLHDLTDQVPSTMYVNREQSPKSFDANLTQRGIDLAFSRKARESNYYFTFDRHRVTIVSGKSTGRLEVGSILSAANEPLAVTNLERTLIDIAVRPNYAGGVAQVLEAFSRARKRVSTNTLVATLKKLDYVYPYHQTIGFYMARTGYTGDQLSMLRQFPIEFDFYLTHGMKKTDHDSSWRVYYPSGF
jgi:hypothetical protein